jgi:hypothetical protein
MPPNMRGKEGKRQLAHDTRFAEFAGTYVQPEVRAYVAADPSISGGSASSTFHVVPQAPRIPKDLHGKKAPHTIPPESVSGNKHHKSPASKPNNYRDRMKSNKHEGHSRRSLGGGSRR